MKNTVPTIADDYDGLYWLLRIAKDPTSEVLHEAAEHMFDFIRNQKKDHLKTERDSLNEIFYISVFQTLMHAEDHDILLKVLKVIKFYIRYVSPLQT